MPILPRHAVDPERFEETSLAPPLGSGPYVVAEVDAGRSVTLRRNPDYWGRDLAVNRGLWNFDTVRLEFYRDANSHFEAFKKGLYDVRTETDPGRWETTYDFPAVRDHRVVKEEFAYGLPKIMTALVFNTPPGRIRRHAGARGDLAAVRFRMDQPQFLLRPLSPHRELFRGQRTVGPRTARRRGRSAPCWRRFPARCAPTCSKAPGRRRYPTAPGATARRCAARWRCSATPATSSPARCCATADTGEPLGFEILVADRDQERLAIAFSQNLKRAGIDLRIRVVDAVQYEQRRNTFDFDMIQNRWDQSLSPGNEQAFYWGTAAADEPGSRNYMGMRSAAADAMIAALLNARGARRVRRRRARARPRADVRHLCRSALPSAGPMGGAMVRHPSSERHLAVRLSARDVVARARQAVRHSMILGSPSSSHLPTGAGVTLDHLFRYAAVQRPDDVALIDPPNRAAFTSGAPRRAHLPGGRPRRHGDRGAAARSRPCDRPDRGAAIAQYGRGRARAVRRIARRPHRVAAAAAVAARRLRGRDDHHGGAGADLDARASARPIIASSP